MAVIEFDGAARRASIGGSTAYQTVNSTYITNFNTYINGTGASTNATTYEPNGSATNWAAALTIVHTMNTTAGNGIADLVIFFTDGLPNLGGNGITQANTLKADGTHIFVLLLSGSSPPITNVTNISGTDRFTGGNVSFITGGFDYSLNTQFLLPQCR